MFGTQFSFPRIGAALGHLFHGAHHDARRVAHAAYKEMPDMYGVRVHLVGADCSAIYLYESRARAETVLDFVEDTGQLPRKLTPDGEIEMPCHFKSPATFEGHAVVMINDADVHPHCHSTAPYNMDSYARH